MDYTTAAAPGAYVQLIGADDRRFFVRLMPGQSFHTHHGFIKHDQIVGTPYGGTVFTHNGHPYIVLQPSLFDLIMRVKRNTAIVYPKEIGYILLKINAVNGARIVEAGTGSGALSLALATSIAPEGRLYTYEERVEMQNLARKNLENAGVAGNVTMKLRNIVEGFDETGVDAVFLDVREPQDFLGQARAALKGGGFFGSIVPTTNQVSNLLTGLQAGGWMHIEVEEILMRSYKLVPERLRPEDRMIGHTGFLVFARKVDPSPPPPPRPPAPVEQAAPVEPVDDEMPGEEPVPFSEETDAGTDA
ncbi:MAG: tRNA (adenine-N1)-methyltransferase [Chloroflexi bacterium]|nr:tRNA (adenine-N1)-methyltransferase [Chloroflexota bacterium]